MDTDDLTKGLRLASPSLRVRVAAIMEMVSKVFEIPASALLEPTRIPRVAEPRQVAMSMIREHSDLSLAEVGSIFRRDHGTVIHAVKAVRNRCETDARFSERVSEISRQVRRRFSA